MSLPKFPEGFSADFLNLTLSEKFLPPGISIQEVSSEPLAECFKKMIGESVYN
mgnify:CR=1 FL=1|jgi:hypothetical protein